MSVIYILILISRVGAGGESAVAVEFIGAAACKNAIAAIEREYGYIPRMALCVPKAIDAAKESGVSP